MNDWATKLRFADREKQYGLPPGLLASVMQQESSGRPDAVSPKGARGLFQFMPDTAKGYGINPDDPEQAAEGAARMYADLLKQHGGDLDKALAGYNWGSGNMAKYGMDNMPAETRNYISGVKSRLSAPTMGGETGNDMMLGGAGADTIDDPFANLPDAASTSTVDDPFEALPAAAAPPAPVATPKKRTMGESFQLGTQQVGQGLADLAGLPVDLTTAALNLGGAGINRALGTDIPQISEPIGGSESIQNAAGNVFELLGGKLVPQDNLSGPEKLLGKINRFGGSAVGGGAGSTRAVATGVADTLTPRVQPIVNSFTEAYSTAPAKAAINDIAAATGAAVGSEAAERIAPDSPLAQLVGTAVGGAGGHTASSVAQGGKEAAVQTVKNIATGGSVDTTLPFDPVTKMPVNRRAANDVADYMQRQASNPNTAKHNIAENFRFYQNEGLPAPTTGTLSDDVGAIGMEKQLRTTNPTPFIERDQSLRAAQADKLRQLGPGIDDANKRDAQTFAKQTADTEINAANAAAETARSSVAKGQEKVAAAKQTETEIPAPIAAARGTGPQSSAQLDKEINEGALKPKTEARNKAVDAVDPEREIMRDTTPLTDLADVIRADANKLAPGTLPNEFMSRLDKLKPKETGTDYATGKKLTTKNEASIGDLLDTRKYLSTAANRAQEAGEFQLATNIRQFKKRINEEVDKLIAEGGPTAERAKAMKARQEEYAPFFSEGFGKQYRDKIQKDSTGRTALPPSQTAAFFLDDVPEAAADLKRIMSIAENPQSAQRAASNYLKADLATKISADGTIQPKTLRAWLDQRKDAIEAAGATDEFNTLYKDVLNGRQATNESMQQLGSLQKELAAAEGSAKATQKRIDGSVLRTLIDNEPENAAAKILNDGDPEKRMQEVMSRLEGNENAMQAWRQAVADHIETKMTGTRTELTGNQDYAVQQGKVEAFLKKPGVEKALQTLYKDKPDSMNALRVAQRIGRDVAKQNIQASTGSITAESAARMNKALQPVELAFKAFLGNLEGGGRMRQLKLVIGSIPGVSNEVAIQRLLLRSQFEPELAIQLYGRETKKIPAATWSKQMRKLLNRGVVAREINDEDDNNTE